MSSSWENEAKWYDSIVAKDGHYYHRQVIFPRLLKLMSINKNASILDLGCGQGVFGRKIPKTINYTGIDLSKSLIASAKKADPAKNHEYLQGDITKSLPLKKRDFSHAVFILSLQNVEKPDQAILQAKKHLRKDGMLFLVLNHPCFRIPRQSSWGIDEAQKIQYRRVNSYLSPLKIPLQAHPGRAKKSVLWSYHFPLSSYFHFLNKAGLTTVHLEEWCSDKKSTGKKAKMENRARKEFPLFLTIAARV